MRKIGIIFIGLLGSLNIFAAEVSKKAEVMRCSDFKIVRDYKENKTYMVSSSYSGGAVTWQQDSKEFVLSFSDVDSNLASHMSVLSMEILQNKLDGSTVTAVNGIRKRFAVMKEKLTVKDQDYETRRTYLATEPSVEFKEQSIINGSQKPEQTVTIIQNKSGSKTVTTHTASEDFPAQQMRVENHTFSCKFTEIKAESMKDEFGTLVMKAVQKFDLAYAEVTNAKPEQLEAARTKRDALMLTLVDGKSFLKAKRSLNPAPGHNSSGGTTVVDSGNHSNGGFGGPRGNGCTRLGSGLRCDDDRGGNGSVCTTFGNGYHCSGSGGVDVCTPFGSGYHCSGDGGVHVCTPFGDGFNCSP